jgi:hypothetical protein
VQKTMALSGSCLFCNQDEDSEEEVDKTAEAPKEMGNEVKTQDFWGGFMKMGDSLIQHNMT